MRANANQHHALDRAFAGIVVAQCAGWLGLSADPSAAVNASITMTPKRKAGGLFQGGIPS
jgi:hypothetical protein